MSGVRQGNLRDLGAGPASLLAELARTPTACGHLMLISEQGEDTGQELLFIQDGNVIACNSLLTVPPRQLLVQAGVISPEVAAEAEAATAGRADLHPEQVLVQSGKISAQEILSTVGSAVKDSCLQAMLRPFGLFIFKPADRVAPPRTLCKLPVRELALAYGRAMDDAHDVLQGFITDGHILKLSPGLEELRSAVRLLPQEWKLIFRVNGRRSVGEIFASLEIPREDFDVLLFTSLLIGALEIGDVKAINLSAGGVVDQAGSSRGGSMAEIARPSGDSFARNPQPPPPSVSGVNKIPSSSVRFMGPSPAAQKPATPGRKRILVVDDSRTIQKMVEAALRELDVDFDMADDGYEAIRLAEAVQPDLVILDVVMPRLDGYKACSRLRKLFNPVRIPIIMLTAKDGTFNFLKGKLAGANAYMTKPFEPEELRQTVREFLAQPTT